MTRRRDLMQILREPRSLSSLARELGLRREDVEDDVRHAIRSARAAGGRVEVVPARCKACGYLFDEERLTKPGKCPACRGSRILEPQISVRET
jgi:predicted Zn-ribbon and HTH transcriptional regulator